MILGVSVSLQGTVHVPSLSEIYPFQKKICGMEAYHVEPFCLASSTLTVFLRPILAGETTEHIFVFLITVWSHI